jgi:hypothetical protein
MLKKRASIGASEHAPGKNNQSYVSYYRMSREVRFRTTVHNKNYGLLIAFLSCHGEGRKMQARFDFFCACHYHNTEDKMMKRKTDKWKNDRAQRAVLAFLS